MTPEERRLPATYASLRLSGEALDPRQVTSLVGIEPSLSYRRGDKFVAGRRGLEQTRKFGLWLYSTRNKVDSDSARKHLDIVEELLLGSGSMWSGSKLRLISSFVSEHAVDLNVSLFWYGGPGVKFPHISRSFKAVVALAGGTLDTDFHRDEDAEVA